MRKMNMNNRLALAVLALSLGATSSVTAQEIKIGSLSALTGPASQPGQGQRNAVQLVVNEVNAKGGIRGQKIKLFVEDDQLSPTAAATAARRLVYKDQVFAIIGTPNSPTALAALEVTMDAKVPQLVIGVAPKITQMNNPYVVRGTPIDTIQAKVIVDYAVANTSARKFAIIADSSDYGKGGVSEVTAALAKHGLQPIAVESFNSQDADFSSQLNKIKASGADALIMWVFYVDAARIVTQAKKLGLRSLTFGSSGVLQGNFLELAGDAANGMYVQSSFTTVDPSPQVQEFVRKYRTQYNIDPDVSTANAYDSINLLVKAIEEVGLDRGKVVNWLRSIDGYQGVTGKKAASAVGDIGKGGNIIQIKDGKQILVGRSD
jgi:branched-chain amino acid transport system substrate-binding protein